MGLSFKENDIMLLLKNKKYLSKYLKNYCKGIKDDKIYDRFPNINKIGLN